jgi:DNA-binding NarL/FixJ family response regulator
MTEDTLSKLSPRETQVLHLMAQGKSNKEIGEELGISHYTVKCFIRLIVIKTGLSRGNTRARLVHAVLTGAL